MQLVTILRTVWLFSFAATTLIGYNQRPAARNDLDSSSRDYIYLYMYIYMITRTDI